MFICHDQQPEVKFFFCYFPLAGELCCGVWSPAITDHMASKVKSSTLGCCLWPTNIGASVPKFLYFSRSKYFAVFASVGNLVPRAFPFLIWKRETSWKRGCSVGCHWYNEFNYCCKSQVLYFFHV